MTIEVTDDNTGAARDRLAKLVTGTRACTRSQGFWRHQASDKGQQHIEDTTLGRYLVVTNVASSVFSELTAAATIEQAHDVLSPQGPSMRDKAEAQLLAAWLNFSSGAIGWTETVNGTAAGERLTRAEAILTDADATHQELEHAKDLAEAVNLHDQDNPDCGGKDNTEGTSGPPGNEPGNGNGNGQGQGQ